MNDGRDLGVNLPLLTVAVFREEDAPRFVILQKSTTGYGFVLRGAKGESMDLVTSGCSTPCTVNYAALNVIDTVS